MIPRKWRLKQPLLSHIKNAMPKAGVAILEPIGTLTAYMPDENLGDIMGDVTKRRGRVLGMGASEERVCRSLPLRFR